MIKCKADPSKSAGFLDTFLNKMTLTVEKWQCGGVYAIVHCPYCVKYV